MPAIMPEPAGDIAVRDAAARDAASRMATAAAAWLDALDPAQRAAATGEAPGAGPADTERRRWFYTPTDHGGLTLAGQRPAQQRLAHRVLPARACPPRDGSS